MQHPIANVSVKHLLVLARLSRARISHQVDLSASHRAQRQRLARVLNH